MKRTPVPTRRLLVMVLSVLPFFLVGLFVYPFIFLGISLDLFILLLALSDYRQTLGTHRISFSTGGSKFFSIGKKNVITLRVRSRGPRPLEIEVKPDIPESWELLCDPGFIDIPPNGEREQPLEYRPTRRGVYRLNHIHYRYKTLSGLLFIYGKEPVDLEIEVFPDVKEINQYLMMTRRNKLYEIGIHRNRFRGMGTNLEYLREYQKDDDSRRIDWKASTRNNKLVCKEYQLESNNLVAIVLDCGRLMTAEQGGMNSLDYAVNASLILSYVADRVGDGVTVFAFSDKIIGELPPVKGRNMMTRVLQFLTRLQPDFVESDYQQVFEHLNVRLKRRALIIFFSDLIDDVNYTMFYKYLSILGRKHIPLIILLRDILLMKNADLSPRKVEDVYVSAAAADMYIRRADVVKKLRQKKINLLDLLPHEVTPALIDKYLELKSRNLV